MRKQKKTIKFTRKDIHCFGFPPANYSWYMEKEDYYVDISRKHLLRLLSPLEVKIYKNDKFIGRIEEEDWETEEELIRKVNQFIQSYDQNPKENN